MSKQPEALRLADWLEETIPEFPEPTRLESEAAKELRRLHAANVDLLTALKAAWKVIGPMSPTNDWVAAGCVIHEAIEKHGGTS